MFSFQIKMILKFNLINCQNAEKQNRLKIIYLQELYKKKNIL